MIAIAYYLLKVIVCSGVLFLYYHLFLRNKIFHQWNRFYLLAAVILSITLPFIRFELDGSSSWSSQEALNQLLVFQSTDQYLQEFVIEYNPGITLEEWLAIGYGVISIFLFVGLAFSIGKVVSILRRYQTNNFANFKLLSTREPGSPFSFLNYIIWNEEIPLKSAVGQQIFQHELVHVQQKHTWDKLFMQAILVMMWCNPFFWLIRKELKFIHEFIADQKAVGCDTEAFAAMILQSVYPNQINTIVNPFFQSSIKRRLHMLTQLKNPRVAYLSRVIALPLVATIAFTVCVRTNAQNAPKTYQQSTPSKIDSTFHRSKQIKNVDVLNDKNSVEVYYNDGTVEKMTRQEANKKGIIIDGGYGNFKPVNPSSPGESTLRLRTDDNLRLENPPLYILDGKGIKKEELEKLNPKEIESINVLKGANATAIYGEKGKNGVVIINRKNILVDELVPTIKEGTDKKNNGDKVELNDLNKNINEVVVQGQRLEKREPAKEVVVKGYPQNKEPIFERAEFSASIDPNEWRQFLEKYSRPIVEEAGKSAPSGKYTVLVKFVVEKDGLLSDIKITNDPGFGIGQKVAEMMKHAPKWKPAIQNEKVVRSYHTQPITFVINNGATLTSNKLELKPSEKTIRQLLKAQDDDTILSFTLSKAGNNGETERLQLEGEEGVPAVRKFLSNLKAGDFFTVQSILVSRNGVKTRLPAVVHNL